MIFLYEQYTFIIVLSLLIVGVSYVLVFRGFNRWIQTHWFYEVRMTHKVAAFFWFGGITCLALALMDLRGPEKIIQGKISNQKTMILIDTSASMFVEDVRPNRFEKSIFLAKHFVKKAVGQKLSVAVFSDAQKTIVPFTDDLDLIEARIEGLKELNLRNGGTGLSIAIQEAVQKFRAVEGDEAGNILIFTDAEETDGGIELTVPDGVSVGVVGIGTRKGGVIPVRNSRKEFIQNKRYQGGYSLQEPNTKKEPYLFHTLSSAPVMVSPGPNATVGTRVVDSASESISFQICGNVADDILPLSLRTLFENINCSSLSWRRS